MLRPGVRIHVRTGYSANALNMPIAFNGTITNVEPSEYVLSIVAQGDGMELEKKLPLSSELSTLKPDVFGWEPRQLITHMLMSCGGSSGEDVFGQTLQQRIWNYSRKKIK